MRHLVQAKDIEVALLHGAAVDGELRLHNCAQPEADATFHLSADHVRVDGHAQSTAHTTRSTFGWPLSSRLTSTICATYVSNDSATATPRKRPFGNGRPQPAFS